MYSNLLRQDMMRNIAAAINKYPLRTKWNYYHGGSRIIAQQTKCLQSSNQSMPIFARNLANDSRQSYPGCKPGTRVVPSYPQPVVSKSQPKVCTPPTPPPKSAGGGGPCDPFDDPQKKKRDERIMIAMIAGATAFALAYFLGLFDKKKYKKDANKVNLSEKKFSRPKVIPRNPEPKDIPKEVPYLLIGGGTASFAAFRAIKSHDPKAKVLVITKEGNYPYMRPPLSKEMWLNQNEETTNQFRFKQWNGIERSLFYEPSDFYAPCTELMERENGGVSVALGYSVEYIDVYAKKVYLDTGDAISYEKCLIATGSKPRNLPILKNAPEKIQEKITLFRSILDFQEIDEVIKLGAKNIAIIGSGFLGSELACSLARKGKNSQLQVYQVFREPGNMGKVLPEYLSNWTTKKVREEGVNVIPNTIIESAKRDGNQLLLTCSDGNVIKADHVIVAVGAKANTDLAIKSDLEIDEDFGGYLVNAELMARSNLWVAGDCTCFYDVKLGRRRVEHHDHAVISGRLAGENMTGAGKPYWHQSMFWSDLGPDVGYEAIGIVDSHLPTVGVFAKANESDTPKKSSGECDESGNRQEKKENEGENKLQEQEKAPTQGVDLDSDTDYGKGVIFYLCEGLVVGIVLWNVFNRISIAREVLKEERKYDDLNEVAKLFNIHNRDVEDEEEILEEALKEVERREEEKKKLSKNSES